MIKIVGFYLVNLSNGCRTKVKVKSPFFWAKSFTSNIVGPSTLRSILTISLGNDRKAFFHFGQNRKGTGGELSIVLVIPAQILSTGRNTLFRSKDILLAKRHIQQEEESLLKHFGMIMFQPVSGMESGQPIGGT